MTTITKENLLKVDEKLFEEFLRTIDVELWEQFVPIYCKVLPNSSPYYISKLGTGIFWKGFRPNKTTLDKYVKVIMETIYHNGCELNLSEFTYFINCLLEFQPISKHSKEFNFTDEELKKAILNGVNIKYVNMLYTMYGLDVDSDTSKYIELVEENNQKWEEKYEGLNRLYNSASSELDDLKLELKNLKSVIKNGDTYADDKYRNLVNEALTKLDISSEYVSKISNLKSTSKDDLLAFNKKIYDERLSLIQNGEITRAKELVLAEYITLCMMEDK